MQVFSWNCLNRLRDKATYYYTDVYCPQFFYPAKALFPYQLHNVHTKFCNIKR